MTQLRQQIAQLEHQLLSERDAADRLSSQAAPLPHPAPLRPPAPRRAAPHACTPLIRCGMMRAARGQFGLRGCGCAFACGARQRSRRASDCANGALSAPRGGVVYRTTALLTHRLTGAARDREGPGGLDDDRAARTARRTCDNATMQPAPTPCAHRTAVCHLLQQATYMQRVHLRLRHPSPPPYGTPPHPTYPTPPHHGTPVGGCAWSGERVRHTQAFERVSQEKIGLESKLLGTELLRDQLNQVTFHSPHSPVLTGTRRCSAVRTSVRSLPFETCASVLSH